MKEGSGVLFRWVAVEAKVERGPNRLVLSVKLPRSRPLDGSDGLRPVARRMSVARLCEDGDREEALIGEDAYQSEIRLEAPRAARQLSRGTETHEDFRPRAGNEAADGTGRSPKAGR